MRRRHVGTRRRGPAGRGAPWRIGAGAAICVGVLVLSASPALAAGTATSTATPGPGLDPVAQAMGGLVSQLYSAVASFSSLLAAGVANGGPGFQGAWFSAAYGEMVALGAAVAVATLVLAATSAAMRSDARTLTRLALRLPAVVIGIAAAPVVLRALDQLFAALGQAMAQVGGGNPATVGAHLSASAHAISVGSQAPLFNVIVLGVTVIAELAWYAVEVVRAAGPYLIVVMLPLFASMSLWPRLRAPLNSALEWVFALFVGQIPLALSFGLAGAVAGSGVAVPNGLANTSSSAPQLLAAAFLLLCGAASPFLLVAVHPVARVEAAAASRRRGAEAPAAPGRGQAGFAHLFHDGVAARSDAAGTGRAEVVGGWEAGGFGRRGTDGQAESARVGPLGADARNGAAAPEPGGLRTTAHEVTQGTTSASQPNAPSSGHGLFAPGLDRKGASEGIRTFSWGAEPLEGQVTAQRSALGRAGSSEQAPRSLGDLASRMTRPAAGGGGEGRGARGAKGAGGEEPGGARRRRGLFSTRKEQQR